MDNFQLQMGLMANKLRIQDGDTIVLQADRSIISDAELYSNAKGIQNYFPNNIVICTLKGIDLNIPPACQYCSNHPSNGGSGICHCILGSPQVTC